jgi:beta-N-acetylhexosaminidase
MKLKRFFSVLALGGILLSLAAPVTAGQAASQQQSSDASVEASALLAQLTPEEKVGQLFLVTFKGTDVSANSQIYDLIINHHIGGVMLQASNDNFTADNTVASTYALIHDLQSTALAASQNPSNTATPATATPTTTTIPAATGKPATKVTATSTTSPVSSTSQTQGSPYIPLFIGISQEGDQYPYDQILSGLTPLPNEMAIGATWNTALADQAGSVLGHELQALGVNMLFGPSLDVLDVSQTDTGESLGTRTFGGDPYWVSVMGQEYIRGIHEGSHNQIAVVATHFPGQGGSDRPPEEEVATVRKSLEQLKQIELAPFFAVTGNAPDTDSTTDGLLVSHIRYQGFQGNIRATTYPVSFDSSALGQILSLAPFASWRTNGGVMVSDDLGSQAVRKFFDPTGQTFDARQVARTAFLAGNDLLYVDNFVTNGDPDSYTTILKTLDYFTQKYNEDPAFAERVDASVLRLLTLKYKLYPSLASTSIFPSEDGLADIGQSQQVAFDIARQAATLINPNATDLSSILTRPPQLNERIIFITDSFQSKQCSKCQAVTTPTVDGLQNAVWKLYGLQAGGQVIQSHLSSYSFADLRLLLADSTNSTDMLTSIQSADWVVFCMLNQDPSRLDSMALKDLLDTRVDLIRNKRVIVFAFNAPYYLDATDISKVTAYYGLYSKGSAFLDVAARILFQELTPAGSSPVSIPGVGYDMITAMSPAPDQVIPLLVDVGSSSSIQPTTSPQPTQTLTFSIGDTIPLRTGVVVDHNHHPVPDGTVVHFIFSTSGDNSTTQQIDATTTQGVAHASYHIQTPGTINIRVTSDPATVSDVLQLQVVAGQPGAVIAISPTLAPTLGSGTLTTENPATPEVAEPTQEAITGGGSPGLIDWLLAMVLVWGAAWGVYWAGYLRLSQRWGIRWGILAAIGGLLAYCYPAFGLMHNGIFNSSAGTFTVLGITLFGIVIGWVAGLLWYFFPIWQRWLSDRQKPNDSK